MRGRAASTTRGTIVGDLDARESARNVRFSEGPTMDALSVVAMMAPGVVVLLLLAASQFATRQQAPLLSVQRGVVARDLTHEETLEWIREHRAWRKARKTRPLWARPVAPDEVGRAFETADHVTEHAREGYWLCVGIAGEPWFQAPSKLEGKYTAQGEEVEKRFAFDTRPRKYRQFTPTGKVFNWVARVEGPGIKGFSIRPNYQPDRPLYSPAGGYVVKDDGPDPYAGKATDDVWLVQKALFESTYELVP